MKQRHKRKQHINHKHYNSLLQTFVNDVREGFKRNIKDTGYAVADSSVYATSEHDQDVESYVVINKMKKYQKVKK